MKTKIGTEVAHITRDSETIFKVKRLVKYAMLLSDVCLSVYRVHRAKLENREA